MDPVLRVFKAPKSPIFDISQRFRTVSIRDQMIRAALLSDRLPGWLDKYCSHQVNRRVLVVGAGACGMTAAVALARQKIVVEVVDRADEPFALQRDCTSRWIDPTQYDWPLTNWRSGRFSWDTRHRSPVFSWSADLSHNIAAKWRMQLIKYQSKGDLARWLTIDTNIVASLPSQNTKTGKAVVKFHAMPDIAGRKKYLGWRHYSAVIWSVGVGREKCRLDDTKKFEGLAFWHTDSLEDGFSGLPDAPTEGEVLISGAGDGAMQDLLRVLTRLPSAARIYEELGLEGRYDPAELLSTEMHAERAVNWCVGAEHAVRYMRHLHEQYQPIIARILTSRVRGKLIRMCANGPSKVHVVTRQPFLTANYALNRFLGLLFLEALNGSRVHWWDSHEVTDVQPLTSRPPSSDPHDYLGVPMTVSLKDNSSLPMPLSTASIVANIVLLRHGLDPLEIVLPAGEVVPEFPRPMPPSYLL